MVGARQHRRCDEFFVREPVTSDQDGLKGGRGRPSGRPTSEVPMLKWKIAAVIGMLCGVGGVSWGYAQQRNAPGFYELRIYKALPGKRDALAARFASRTAAIYARHGITNVGY